MTCEFRSYTRPDGTQTLRISLPVANPNPSPIRIERVVYSIRAGTRVLAESHSIRRESLAQEEHTVLHIEYDAPGWPYVLEAWKASESRRLEGHIHVLDHRPASAFPRREEFYFECMALPH